MKQAQASEDHIKSTVSQELHDLHEQFHRAGCSTETPLSRGRQMRKEERNLDGAPLSAGHLRYQFAGQEISLLLTSQQAHVEAVFLFYRWRIWDSADFPKTTKLKSSTANLWLWLEACAFSTETLSSSWQGASMSMDDGFSMSSFLHFCSCSLILITLRGLGCVSITELSVQQASLRPGADLVGPGAQHWTTVALCTKTNQSS